MDLRLNKYNFISMMLIIIMKSFTLFLMSDLIPLKVFKQSSIDKAKIIINASEEKLGYLIEEFQKMKVDLSSIPIMINSTQFQSDISAFLGTFFLIKDGRKIVKILWPFKVFLSINFHQNSGSNHQLKKLMSGVLKLLYPDKMVKYLNSLITNYVSCQKIRNK